MKVAVKGQPNVNRKDWDMAGLVKTFGAVYFREPPHSNPYVSIFLPWPDHKLPVVVEFARVHHLSYRAYPVKGSSPFRGRARPRPVVRVQFAGSKAYDLCRALDWTCGDERKDRIMRAIRAWGQRKSARGVWHDRTMR